MIITADELQSYLGITDDTQASNLRIFAEGASAYIESMTGRLFELKTATEYYDGKAQMDLVVDNYPISSITSLKYNSGDYQTPVWTSFDATSYEPNLKNGIVMFTGNVPRGFQNIQVVYTFGYAQIPFDLKLAALQLAAMYYNQKDASGITSESVGGDSITFDKVDVPASVASVIANYSNV